MDTVGVSLQSEIAMRVTYNWLKYFICIAIFISVVIFCISYAYAQDNKIDSQTQINIKLQVEAPFSEAKVTIDNNGRIEYKEIYRGDKPPPESLTNYISREELEKLARFILERNFFSWYGKYEDEGLMDGSTYVFTISIGNKTKSVSCYANSGPEGFYEIKAVIEDLLGRKILEVGV